jgi:hypothetical protein
VGVGVWGGVWGGVSGCVCVEYVSYINYIYIHTCTHTYICIKRKHTTGDALEELVEEEEEIYI